MGYALGAVGLSLDDFCRLTPTEYASVCKAWQAEEQRRLEDAWERMRLQTVITVQPHVKKKLDPKKMLPLPWERKKPKAEVVSREEAKRRFEKLTKSGK